MRSRLLLLLLPLAILLQACLVVSIHPFVREDQAVFKKELVGKWRPLGEDGKPAPDEDSLIIERDEDAGTPAYLIRMSAFEEGKKTKEWTFKARVMDRDGHLLLDYVAESSEPFLLPVHGLARVGLDGDTLVMWALDREHFAKALKAGDGKIPGLESTVTEDDLIVLTSKSDAIQAYLFAHLKDKDLWGEPGRFQRAK